MDYGTVGYDRPSSLPSGAAAAPTSNIRDAATWDGYLRNVIRDITRMKKGGSKSVPNGERIGLEGLSQDAHPFVPLEWWSAEARRLHFHLAECAVFEHVAVRLNMRPYPVSKETLALCHKMLATGEIDEEFKPKEGEKGFGDKPTFMDDVDMESEPSADEEAAIEAANKVDRASITAARLSIKSIIDRRDRAANATPKASQSKDAPDEDEPSEGESGDGSGGGAGDDDQAAASLARFNLRVKTSQDNIAARTPGPLSARRPGQTRPVFTMHRREKLGPEPEKSTPKTAKDRAALLQLRTEIGGVTYMHAVDLERTAACLFPSGQADISDMPVGILTDISLRQKADAAGVDILVNSYRDVDGGVGAGLTEMLRDATCLKILKAPSAKDNLDLSPLDILFNLMPVSSMLMAAIKKSYVEPTVTLRAQKFRGMVENITFKGARGELDAATPHAMLQAGLSESGSGPKDNDWSKLTKEVLAALSDAVDLVFVGVDLDGVPLDWAQMVQTEIDRHSGRKHGEYDQSHFQLLADTISRYGLAQIRRTEAITGLQQLRSKPNAGQVNMLGAGWGASDAAWALEPSESGVWGDDGAAAWGRVPSYLTADEDHMVLYVGGDKCLKPSCGATLKPHFASCMACGTFQDKVWRCGKCNLFTRGEYARCRYGLTSGCPGTREEGRTATLEEYAAAAAVMSRAKEEKDARGLTASTWGGKGGKGAGKGSAGGKGGGLGKGFGGKGASRVAVLEAVERGMASGDSERLVQEVRRAYHGC
jgi:hypothetical protein